MVQFSYVINDELGLHARPAGLLVKLASGFTSTITLKCENGEADAKRNCSFRSDFKTNL